MVLRNPKHCGLCGACQGEQGVLTQARFETGKMEEALLGHPAQEQGEPLSSAHQPPRMKLLTQTSASLATNSLSCPPPPPCHTHPSFLGICAPPKTNQSFSGCVPFPSTPGKEASPGQLLPQDSVVFVPVLSPHSWLSQHIAPLLTFHIMSLFVACVVCLLPPCTDM